MVKGQGGMKPPPKPPNPSTSGTPSKAAPARSVQKQGVRVKGIGGSRKSF
jgi:hypothetical protein